eukprot:GHVU01022141.1.p2 GENE.GHVU01022141.1~~GHVU01022141.1.p2  ORF type:complete len:135 (-),score=8.40 GHVU01022141.1:1150-1554(-)
MNVSSVPPPPRLIDNETPQKIDERSPEVSDMFRKPPSGPPDAGCILAVTRRAYDVLRRRRIPEVGSMLLYLVARKPQLSALASAAEQRDRVALSFARMARRVPPHSSPASSDSITHGYACCITTRRLHTCVDGN